MYTAMRPLLSLLALVHVATLSKANSVHYYIVPAADSDLCHKYPTNSCFTLDKLSSHYDGKDGEDITLSYLPGEHTLTKRVTFVGVRDVTLQILHYPKSNMSVKIHCHSSEFTGFSFESVENLVLEGIELQECTNVHSGGAVFISKVTNVMIRDCVFNSNQVTSTSTAYGGAIYMCNTAVVSVQSSSFTNNSAQGSESSEGGAIFIAEKSSIKLESCLFEMNTVTVNGNGGALALNAEQQQNLTITNTSFITNSAIGTHVLTNGNGGAIYFRTGHLLIENCLFFNNSATILGGGICFDGSNSFFNAFTFTSIHTRYTSNRARKGGALHSMLIDVATEGNEFFQNSATEYGGAISTIGKTLSSLRDTLVANSCDRQGGAIYMYNKITPTTISEALFSRNVAQHGAGIYQVDDWMLEISNSTFTENYHTSDNTGTLYLTLSTVILTRQTVFKNNRGSLYSFNGKVRIQGEISFTHNSGDTGGAISCIQSTITFEATSSTTLSENEAVYGGGMSLTQCIMYIFGQITMTSNRAGISGGGIFAIQSTILIKRDSTVVVDPKPNNYITRNTANSDGGGMLLIASSIEISGKYVYIHSNSATRYGGGIFLEQTSTINLNKIQFEYEVLYEHQTIYLRLEFAHNTAQQGGAVYVSDNTNSRAICGGTLEPNVNIHVQQCFLQTLLAYVYLEGLGANLVNTFFVNNTATNRGGDIYGGLLDRCMINPSAELLAYKPEYKNANGLDYMFVTASFDWDHNTDKNMTELSRHISSDPIQICFCLGDDVNCNHTHLSTSTKKGEMFTVNVVAADQVKGPLNAKIISSLLSVNGGEGRLKEGQEAQVVTNKCSELKFNAYSTDNSAKLQLYPEGPCGDQGPSKRDITIIFTPCICPIGFQRSPPPIDCVCECDQRLQPYISNCSTHNKTVQVVENVWIDYINTTNESGFVVQDCPFDYCVSKPVNITFKQPSEIDEQCAFNRTGTLCGGCTEGLSLVFASSQCKRCSNYYISLLAPFALAGIVLVVLILVLNMTVAAGALYGLLFYANIVAANRSVYIPSKTSNVLTVFISWLNLDLGIETCFFDGMDSNSKVLLQLVFPVYLFLLLGAIYIVCKYSGKLTYLLSKTNPIAAFCTLILLSYSKLLRFLIIALQLTTVKYPDGTHETVWLYNGNVNYLSVDRIPQLIAAAIIIITGTVYTVLLLFGQWLQACSKYKLMRWVSNTKYTSFIEAYRMPIVPKHYYWVGLLLFARIAHHLISAFSSNSVAIFSTGIIVFSLITLKTVQAWINSHEANASFKMTYTHRVVEILETSLLINLGVLSLGTLYEAAADRGIQSILVNISMATTFLAFIAITTYHIVLRILEYSKLNWEDVLARVRRTRVPWYNRRDQPRPQATHIQGIVSRTYFDELRENILDDSTQNDAEPLEWK